MYILYSTYLCMLIHPFAIANDLLVVQCNDFQRCYRRCDFFYLALVERVGR